MEGAVQDIVEETIIGGLSSASSQEGTIIESIDTITKQYRAQQYRVQFSEIMLQLQNRTYFHPTKYEIRETIEEIKDVNACITIFVCTLINITVY